MGSEEAYGLCYLNVDHARVETIRGMSTSVLRLTHWGRVTHTCVSKLTSIGSDNGLSPGRRKVIIWTNACILLIGPLGTNFSEMLVKILTFSFTKMRLNVSSAKWRPFCDGLNVLRAHKPLKPMVYIIYSKDPRIDMHWLDIGLTRNLDVCQW